MENSRKKEKKKRNTVIHKNILEIVPIRGVSENGYFYLDDSSYMELLQIKGKDLINSAEDEVEFDCLRFSKLYRLYADDLKIVCMNFPSDYGKQKRFLEYKIKNAKNEIYKLQLRGKLNELIWLEKHNTTREYYLMLFAQKEEVLEKNIRTVTAALGTGRGGLIAKLSLEKKKEILFRLLNKCILSNN